MFVKDLYLNKHLNIRLERHVKLNKVGAYRHSGRTVRIEDKRENHKRKYKILSSDEIA